MPLPLTDIPPERLTEDLVERTLYARDLAPVPRQLTRAFFQTLPDAVVRPGTAAEVSAVMTQAARQQIPVTPRAAASSSYYNAVPVRGGLVLDVNDLRHGIGLDPQTETVRVLPATTWFELDDGLQQEGFTVNSYPSSAVAATVGGWVNMQGYGIGSLRYGGLAEQLVALEVVLPDGRQRTVTRYSDPPLDWFVASEGTMGVVVEVELAVRPLPAAESHHLLAFSSLDALGAGVESLARNAPRPYTIFFADDRYLSLLADAGFHVPPTAANGESGILLVNFQGEAAEVARGKDRLRELAAPELSSELALAEWSLRLYHLRAKRAGPSLLAAEMWLPLRHLAAYLQAVNALSRRSRQVIGTYGLAVTPDEAQVMSIYPADERHQLAYMAAIGFTKRLYDLGACFEGRPYGIGLWNTPYLSRLFSRARLREVRRRKARLDPHGIMNPGKLYAAPFPLWPVTFRPAAGLLAAAHTLSSMRHDD